eukprot:12408295-Karenia_brevis.AAC.1
MCIAHHDKGDIAIQLEFIEENNTVIVKCNDSDYSAFFKSNFISTFDKLHAREASSPDAHKAKTPFERFAWKPRIGTYDMTEPVPEKILNKKKKLQWLSSG